MKLAVPSSIVIRSHRARKASPMTLSMHRTAMIRLMAATKIATPPMRGIGRSWIVRTPGRSTAPIRGAIPITIGVAISATRTEPK